MTTLNVETFTKVRGNPEKFFSGIRWFNVDGQQVQLYARGWAEAKNLILSQYPNAQHIELLVK